MIGTVLGLKIAGGFTGVKKMAAIGFLTSTCADVFWGTVTYHYHDGKKKQTARVPSSQKRKRRHSWAK